MASMTRAALTIALLVLAACGSREASSSRALPSPGASVTATHSVTPSSTTEPAVKLVAAGDIASCEESGDSATAALIADMEADVTIAMLGDAVYPSGSDEAYAECYDPVWGAWLDRTRPALGNHDTEADGGAAYHGYFGDL